MIEANKPFIVIIELLETPDGCNDRSGPLRFGHQRMGDPLERMTRTRLFEILWQCIQKGLDLGR